MNDTIIDAHLHPFLTADCRINKYQAVKTPDDFVAHLRQNGITQCCGSVVRAVSGDDFGPVRTLNDDALEFRRRYPGFYIPGIHVHGRFPDESCRELERCHREGINLIGELVPYFMGYDAYAGPAMQPVWDLASELGYVVSIHPSTLEDMDTLLTDFPRLTVIIAHPGEYDAYMAKLDLLRRHPNAYLDICGTGLFRYGMLKYGVDQVGAGRFLFGTDFPVCSVGMQVGGVLSEDLAPAERQAIFADNAKRLLQL